MNDQRLSRRRFLRVAGLTLGATAGACALGCSGLALLGSHLPTTALPPAVKPALTFEGSDMSKKILVVYASRAGSTSGVAESVGHCLARSGAQVDVCSIQDGPDPARYQAIVAGSAIHGSAWLPEALGFVHDHRSALAQRPFAAFMTCMTLSMAGSRYRQAVAEWMQPVRDLVRPVSEGHFAGALDFSVLPFNTSTLGMRAACLIGVWQEGDHRDWQAIDSWAEGLKPLLL